MNRLCLALLLLCCAALASAAGEDSASAQMILDRRPQLQSGGATPQTFAAWANARYLLQEALYLGRVTSLGDKMEAHLFIANERPVLVCWSSSATPVTVKIALGKQAKLFAWGAQTRKLRGTTLTISVSEIPLFVRDVQGAYVAEAVRETLADEALALPEAARALLGPRRVEAWTAQRMSIAESLRGKDQSKGLEGLSRLESSLDDMMQAISDIPEAADRSARFALFRQLLYARLQLCEVRIGVAQWQGKTRNARPFSEVERIKLCETFVHWLAQAEPRAALRGYPVTGGLLRAALADLEQMAAGGIFPREQGRLQVLCTALGRLLALESPAVQHLYGTAAVVRQEHAYTLVLTLRNTSEEQAVGSVQFTWGETKVEKQFRLPAGVTGTLQFPLTARPTPDFAVRMAGELSDGAPILPRLLSVTFTDAP